MRVSIGLPVADWRACAVAACQSEEGGADAVTASELKHDPFAPLTLAAPATEVDAENRWPPRRQRAANEKRYGGIADTVSLDFAPGTDAATRHATIAAIQRIPSTFKGFRT